MRDSENQPSNMKEPKWTISPIWYVISSIWDLLVNFSKFIQWTLIGLGWTLCSPFWSLEHVQGRMGKYGGIESNWKQEGIVATTRRGDLAVAPASPEHLHQGRPGKKNGITRSEWGPLSMQKELLFVRVVAKGPMQRQSGFHSESCSMFAEVSWKPSGRACLSL